MDLALAPRRMQNLNLRGDRHMFSTSDDQAMLKQVQATHAPDGREFAVKPLLYIIEDIFQRSAPGIPGFVMVGILSLNVSSLAYKADIERRFRNAGD